MEIRQEQDEVDEIMPSAAVPSQNLTIGSIFDPS
jgi:hypothetical protein